MLEGGRKVVKRHMGVGIPISAGKPVVAEKHSLASNDFQCKKERREVIKGFVEEVDELDVGGRGRDGCLCDYTHIPWCNGT